MWDAIVIRYGNGFNRMCVAGINNGLVVFFFAVECSRISVILKIREGVYLQCTSVETRSCCMGVDVVAGMGIAHLHLTMGIM